jgi:uncharacterized protein YijF (DUF1287 family)
MKILYSLALIVLISFENLQIDFELKLSNAAIGLTKSKVNYNGRYLSIPYPNGDVPATQSDCTDVIIRTYRKLGIDLQREVHEDMKSNFSKYPKTWGLKKTATNIDHRRVPNLETFFTRKGQELPITHNTSDFKTRDLVTLIINDILPHVGIVTHLKSSDSNRTLIVHNVGAGQVLQDCLFSYKIVRHYRYKK